MFGVLSSVHERASNTGTLFFQNCVVARLFVIACFSPLLYYCNEGGIFSVCGLCLLLHVWYFVLFLVLK